MKGKKAKPSPLNGREILLGVTGGIAAYKAAELTRLLVKEGAKVRVVMTASATKFITPLTFQALSGRPVMTDLFLAETEKGIDHIAITDAADLFIIAPATANCIGKLANGLGDDALSTLALAFDGPFLIAPAMNSKMYGNDVVQYNLRKLKTLGFRIVGPETGELACGTEGKGRMSDPAAILDAAEGCIPAGGLSGKKVLVTAGPTREPVDPVRYLTNRSSGKMGYAVAKEAARRGAEVTLVSGPVSIDPPAGVETVRVTTAKEMHRAVMERAKGMDVIVMAAAVSDYRPASPAGRKIKKGDAPLELKLEKTADILADLGKATLKNCLLVGFAAETNDLVENAKKKLKEKKLDLVVANDVSEEGAGFDADTNRVTLIDKKGIVMETGLLAKGAVAGIILDAVSERLS